jgi:ABC-type nitrate/sulfonate/bicarbonate transport system substrate-binding protein
VAAGEPVTSVMAILQHTATEIAYKANRPDIKTPKDLDGKTYAGFGQPYEVPTLQTVIKNAGGTGKFKVVTLNTASYEAVYKGAADFTIPFVAWEGIQATLLHEPLSYFKFTDYGFPDFYQVDLIGNSSFLQSNQSLATRFVQASAKGFTYAAQNPSAAAKLLIDANPGVFNMPQLVYQSADLLAKSYYLDASGKFGTQTISEWQGYSSFLYNHGLLVDAKGKPITSPPNYATLFTNRYLNGT